MVWFPFVSQVILLESLPYHNVSELLVNCSTHRSLRYFFKTKNAMDADSMMTSPYAFRSNDDIDESVRQMKELSIHRPACLLGFDDMPLSQQEKKLGLLNLFIRAANLLMGVGNDDQCPFDIGVNMIQTRSDYANRRKGGSSYVLSNMSFPKKYTDSLTAEVFRTQKTSFLLPSTTHGPLTFQREPKFSLVSI